MHNARVWLQPASRHAASRSMFCSGGGRGASGDGGPGGGKKGNRGGAKSEDRKAETHTRTLTPTAPLNTLPSSTQAVPLHHPHVRPVDEAANANGRFKGIGLGDLWEVFRIHRWLDLRHNLMAMQSCRALFWKIPHTVLTVDFSGLRGVNAATVERVTSQFPAVSSIDLAWSLVDSATIARIVSRSPALKKINLSYCAELGDGALEALAACPSLSELSHLRAYPCKTAVTVQGLQNFFQRKGDSLRSIALTFRGYTLSRMSAYQRARTHGKDDVDEDILGVMSQYCSALEELQLELRAGSNANSHRVFAELMRKTGSTLRTLCLRWFPLSEESQEAIGAHCSSLIKLDLPEHSGLCGRSELTAAGLTSILRGGSALTLTSLNLYQNSSCITADSAAAIASCHALKELNLAGYLCEFGEFMSTVTDDIIQVIAQGCGGLEKLNLHNAPLTDRALETLGRCCPLLTELDLSANCGECDRDGHGGTQSMPTIGAYTDDGVVALASGCHKLRVLDLHMCTKLTDRSLKALAEHCNKLETLDLSGVCIEFQRWGDGPQTPLYTDDGITSLAMACQGLRSLNLHVCNRLTDRALEALAVYCTKLEDLDLSGTDQVVPEIARREVCDGRLFGKRLVGHDGGVTMMFTDQAVAALVQQCSGLAAKAKTCKLHLTKENDRQIRSRPMLHALLDRCTICQGHHAETLNLTQGFSDQSREQQRAIITEALGGFQTQWVLEQIPPYDQASCPDWGAQDRKVKEDSPKLAKWLLANKTTSELFHALSSEDGVRAALEEAILHRLVQRSGPL